MQYAMSTIQTQF